MSRLLPSSAMPGSRKSKVPTPPRQEKKLRPRPEHEQRAAGADGEPAGSGRKRVLLVAGGAAVAAVGVAIALVLTLGGGAGDALAAAGCTDQEFPSQGRQHVEVPQEGFAYNSFPPTSGPHHPQYAIWNVYDRPVQQLRLIHNLEHGAIVVQYGDAVSQETVDEIVGWYRQDPTATVVAPLPALDDKVALTAWTKLAVCPGFEQQAFDSFRDANIFQGPEKFPASSLQPGM